ncbi:hypothetical protein SDC9_50758 [bioreactor metagenome]|uniref:Uncharacterized protein n=1 Tax=bioreactor metagenome TaxID=1076179 RepID=A0A644WLP4_9ZZZZ
MVSCMGAAKAAPAAKRAAMERNASILDNFFMKFPPSDSVFRCIYIVICFGDSVNRIYQTLAYRTGKIKKAREIPGFSLPFSVSGRFVGYEGRKLVGVDVAAGQEEADLFARLDLEAAFEGRRHAHRCRGFHEQLALEDDLHESLVDKLIRGGNDLVHVLVDERIVVFAGHGDHKAVGEGGAHGDLHGLPGLPALGVALDPGGFHGDHPHGGPGLLDGRGYAGEEAAAAEGNHNGVHVGEVFNDLEARRALARDEFRVVVGVNEGVALFRLDLVELLVALDGVEPVEDHFSAEGLRPLDLRLGGVLGKDEGGLDAEHLRRVGHALGVVPGGRGDDALRPLLVGEGEDLVGGSTDLEGSRKLEILRLEVDLRAPQGVKLVSPQDGGPPHLAGDSPGRVFYVLKSDNPCHCTASASLCPFRAFIVNGTGAAGISSAAPPPVRLFYSSIHSAMSGQVISHRLHLMQSDSRTAATTVNPFWFVSEEISYTFFGQTEMHRPHPLQSRLFTCTAMISSPQLPD